MSVPTRSIPSSRSSASAAAPVPGPVPAALASQNQILTQRTHSLSVYQPGPGAVSSHTQRIRNSTSGHASSPILKSLATGSAVIMEMLSGGLFLENTKMEKQRTSLPYPHLMRQTLRQGLKGFWGGFWPWGFILGMTKGSVIGGSRAVLLAYLEKHMSRRNADLLSGFGAGAVQGAVISPLLLARVRVNQSITERAAAAAARGGVINTGLIAEASYSMQVLNTGIREEGFSMLFKGMPALVVKRTLDWGARFYFFGTYKRLFLERAKRTQNRHELNNFELLTASFFGGTTSCAITMPIDRMMPILQQSRSSAAAAGDVGVLSYLRTKLATEGIATLGRGFVMRATHTGYHTMFALFVADKLYKLLGIEDDH
jgi:Mitochondrial carrier protein